MSPERQARVVGTTMMNSSPHQQGIPDLFYAQRIQHLVATGQLESQGDLNHIHSSELRLAGKESQSIDQQIP